MKIRVLLIDKDINYLERISTTVRALYDDKLELHTFSKVDAALDAMNNIHIDVVLVDETVEISELNISKNIAFAYTCAIPDAEEIRGKDAICKFQNIERIYKQILGLYADLDGAVKVARKYEGGTKTVVFTAPSGGVGTSTVAVACARALAQTGKKVLYMDLSSYGNCEMFFQGNGQGTFSDVIFALKSRRSNLALKIQSVMKQDGYGVSYFSAPEVALDMKNLKEQEIVQLIEEIKVEGIFDFLFIDMEMVFNGLLDGILEYIDEFIFVCSGRDIANSKFRRLHETLRVMGNRGELMAQVPRYLVYNMFSNKMSVRMDDLDIEVIFGVPPFEHATTQMCITEISKKREILSHFMM